MNVDECVCVWHILYERFVVSFLFSSSSRVYLFFSFINKKKMIKKYRFVFPCRLNVFNLSLVFCHTKFVFSFDFFSLFGLSYSLHLFFIPNYIVYVCMCVLFFLVHFHEFYFMWFFFFLLLFIYFYFFNKNHSLENKLLVLLSYSHFYCIRIYSSYSIHDFWWRGEPKGRASQIAVSWFFG